MLIIYGKQKTHTRVKNRKLILGVNCDSSALFGLRRLCQVAAFPLLLSLSAKGPFLALPTFVSMAIRGPLARRLPSDGARGNGGREGEQLPRQERALRGKGGREVLTNSRSKKISNVRYIGL